MVNIRKALKKTYLWLRYKLTGKMTLAELNTNKDKWVSDFIKFIKDVQSGAEKTMYDSHYGNTNNSEELEYESVDRLDRVDFRFKRFSLALIIRLNKSKDEYLFTLYTRDYDEEDDDKTKKKLIHESKFDMSMKNSYAPSFVDESSFNTQSYFYLFKGQGLNPVTADNFFTILHKEF